MTTKRQIIEAIKNNTVLNDHLDENAIDCLYNEDLDADIDLDTFRDDAQTYINESVQIIYYSNAIEYLKENDASLRESIEIAAEFCTPLESITSELLATLLVQRDCENALCEIISELEGE